MGGNDDALAQQGIQRAWLIFPEALSKESLPPVLLALTGIPMSPTVAFEFALEADDD
jgi:hypothetical protein